MYPLCFSYIKYYYNKERIYSWQQDTMHDAVIPYTVLPYWCFAWRRSHTACTIKCYLQFVLKHVNAPRLNIKSKCHMVVYALFVIHVLSSYHIVHSIPSFSFHFHITHVAPHFIYTPNLTCFEFPALPGWAWALQFIKQPHG